MDTVFALLNQPIVLALLSLTIGGYLLSLLSDRRARKDKIREKAIELLTEVGDNINAVTARLFGILRSKKVQLQKGSDLDEKIGRLFIRRMSVQVRSKAYLNSEEFYRRYEYLVWQLRRVRDSLVTLSGEYDLEQETAKIQAQKKRLLDFWPLEDELQATEGEPPFSELLSLTQMIVNRAVWLLSSNLKSVLK